MMRSTQPKDRRVAAVLAFAGAIPLPVLHATASGLHKFYLGQTRWGMVYLLLCFTPIPAIASVLEGLWYLFQDRTEFDQTFNHFAIDASHGAINGAIVTAITHPLAAPIAQQMSAQQVSAQQVSAQQVSAIATALRELETLRQEGLITEYEFEQKRRQLLDNC